MQTKTIVESGSFPTRIGDESIFFKKILNTKEDNQRTRIIIVHGLTEYHERYIQIAEEMIQNFAGTLDCWLIDLKGHGLSSGIRCSVYSFDEFVEDLYYYFCMDIDKYQFNFFLGHSMGGLVILKTLLNFRKQLESIKLGVILSAPSLKTHPKYKKFARIRNLPFKEFSGKLRIPNTAKGKDIARDPDAAAFYDTDSLIARSISLNLINQIQLAGEEVRVRPYFMDKPLMLLLPGKDEVIDSHASEAFFHGILNDQKVLCCYPNAKHECLNDPERPEMLSRILAWMGQFQNRE